ncbi:Methylthioribose kinase [Balamuthia mandrillaris]
MQEEQQVEAQTGGVERSIVRLVCSTPCLRQFFLLERKEQQQAEAQSEESGWSVKEIGDGNLNFVYVVTRRFQDDQQQQQERSLVVKQAVPYVRMVGESWPLSPERAFFEHEALREHHRHAPEHVPRVFHFFPGPHHATVMEYLSNSSYRSLRKSLIRARKHPALAPHMARFLARSLFFTSAFCEANRQQNDRLRDIFDGNQLYRLTQAVIFEEPFTRNHKNNRWTSHPLMDEEVASIQANAALLRRVEEAKTKFLTHKEALLHADLHTGSVLVGEGGGETKVLDPEFAFFGPIAFDVGQFVGNLLLAVCSQRGLIEKEEEEEEKRKDMEEWILTAIEELWDRFLTLFRDLVGQHSSYGLLSLPLHEEKADAKAGKEEEERIWGAFTKQLLRDVLAFSGVVMIRRIVGIAHAEDMEVIQRVERKVACERRALRMAQQLILASAPFDEKEKTEEQQGAGGASMHDVLLDVRRSLLLGDEAD